MSVESESSTVTFQQILKAVKKYRKTGELTSNPTIIRAMYNAQKNIANDAAYFPQYELMRINAIHESRRLEDIMKSRNIPY